MVHVLKKLTGGWHARRRGFSDRNQIAQASPEGGHARKILFVCTANVCRSPMAEVIFNALAEDKGLPFHAKSAGTSALKDEPMALNAVAALEEVGIYPGPHRAQRVSEASLKDAALVLVMSPRHAEELRRLFGTSQDVYTLSEYATGSPDREGIPDPYGHNMVTYRSSVRQLYEYVERTIKKLDR